MPPGCDGSAGRGRLSDPRCRHARSPGGSPCGSPPAIAVRGGPAPSHRRRGLATRSHSRSGSRDPRPQCAVAVMLTKVGGKTKCPGVLAVRSGKAMASTMTRSRCEVPRNVQGACASPHAFRCTAQCSGLHQEVSVVRYPTRSPSTAAWTAWVGSASVVQHCMCRSVWHGPPGAAGVNPLGTTKEDRRLW